MPDPEKFCASALLRTFLSNPESNGLSTRGPVLKYSDYKGDCLKVTRPGSVVTMASILDMLFGCTHKNYSFPITNKRGQRRSPAAALTGTYVVCLDCGKEFAYDWHEMKVVSGRPDRNKAMAASAAESYVGE